MKKISFTFILFFCMVNLSLATTLNFPHNIKSEIYDPATVVIKGEMKADELLFRRDHFKDKPIKEIQSLANKLFMAHNVSENIPHMFYIATVEVKEILKNESPAALKVGDKIFAVFVIYNGRFDLMPREDTEFWLFLDASKESTVKHLTKCFKYIKRGTVEESSIGVPPETLYFNGVGTFPLMDYIEDSYFTKALLAISQVYQIEDIEEQSDKWKEFQSKHKDNSFLQNEWEEPNMAEYFYN
ncbi:MAG: hypothetical protein KAI43_01920 [Candidatus Aureabacteria bacterium]|nr:hypothetical protein [Candidatus Auribacterota bacterium]